MTITLEVARVAPVPVSGGQGRPHGTYVKRKLENCRCYPCCFAESEYSANRRRAIAYGTWRPYVDAAPVRQHTMMLAEFGIGWMRLARISGVPRGSVSKLLYGDPQRGLAPSKRMLPKNAAAILSVEPLLEHLGNAVLIDGTGTRRRLRALVAGGWPKAQLAVRLGSDPANFARTVDADDALVKVGTLRAATALYDRLWRADPRDHGVRGRWYTQARQQAVVLGWAPVGAWDDDSIDSPAAFPDWTGRCGTSEGYYAHYRIHIPVCEPCRGAYAQEWRRKNPKDTS